MSVVPSETRPAAVSPARSAGATQTSPRRSPVTVVVRWVLPHLILATVLLALVRWAARPLPNPDTWFHLRFGHEFLTDWSLRDPGWVTTYATQPWVPTQWLPQVVMAWTEDHLGLAGVAWLAGLQYVALATALFLAARRVADPVVAAPLTVLALIGSVSGMSARPQVISYVLTAVVVVAWQRAAERQRPPWVLVPVTWAWAMCHGMWPLGVVIGVGAVVGLALDRRVRGRGLLVWAAVPLASLLVAGLLTPVGPRLLPAVLSVNARGHFFSEWGAPEFTSAQPLVVLLVLATTVLLLVRRDRPEWTTLVLVGLAGGLLVYSQRTVPVAAAALVPLAAAELQRLVGRPDAVRRSEVATVVAGVVVALGALAVAVPSTSASPPPQPAWVDSELGAMPAGTRILNDSVTGGYLMWRYPDLDVLFSGYGDIYTERELQHIRDVADLEPGWVGLVRDAQPAYALVNPDTKLAYALRTQEGWSVVRDDEDVQLLQPPAGWMDR